jgi:nitrogen fixation-related uncharacterized protein
MPIGVIMFLAWMALEIVYVAGMIVWGYETGQWKDIEEPKYRMLIDLEPQPWPGRKPSTQAVARPVPPPENPEPTETPK